MKPTNYEIDTTPPPVPAEEKAVEGVVKEAWKQEKIDEQEN